MSAFIERELAAAQSELSRVDSKCGINAAVVTGIGAVALVLATQHGHLAPRVLAALSALVLAASVFALLSAVRPKLGPSGWCRYAGLGWDGVRRLECGMRPTRPFYDEKREIGAADHPDDMAVEDLAMAATLLRSKYVMTRVAVDLARAGVVLLVLSGIVASLM